MYKQSLLSASIVLALSSTSAFAEDYALFDEVVVSATRTEQNKEDVSSSIESVSSEDIDNQMSNDIKQALQYTPGVEAQGSGRFGISGFNIRGVEGDRVKLMIDGVQQPTPYNPGAAEQRKYSNAIEVDTLSVIEANKGPASTLYGSDAIGGAVLLRTKNPEDMLRTDGDENRFGIKSSYTSADEQFKNTLSWAMRKDKLETIVMATYAQGHETETHSSGSNIEGPDRGAVNPADTELSNFLAKALYNVSDSNKIGLTVEHYQRQYDEDELNYNGYTLMPGFVYTDNYNEDTNKRFRATLEQQLKLNSSIADSLDWSLSYQDSSTLNKNYDTTGFNGRRLRERDASDVNMQVDTQLSKLVNISGADHEFTYGFTYLQNDFELDNTDYKFDQGTVTPGSTGIPDAKITQWGVFLQDQAFFMDDKLIVTGGLRYDSFVADPSTDDGYTTEYDKNEDDAFTAKLGSVYHINDSLSVFGQIGQGFKAPSVYDLYYFYNQGAIVEANPNLKAERSLSYELGLRGSNQFTRFELSMFYTDYTDFINETKTGEQGGKDAFTKENLDEVTIYGAEFSSTINLDTLFDAPYGTYTRLAVAYADGEDKSTGKSIDSVAPLTSTIGLGIERDNFGSALNVKMVASKDDWNSDDNVDVSGYTVVDLTAYYRPMIDLTLRAGLFNALDKKYWLYSDMSGNAHDSQFNTDIKSQPGRNWGLSANYEF
ncbi:TonB-dependent hemoglobin/transferrin/lactoferrin family receptor [Vibrio kanaloae]|uniref:TonB-dependent hemoglobin/transferrin/lactoferrin family receptor n=1 Tax=Vibrio kanaloae TaxID=170673 RepID=UPI0010BE832F|nr:TonB-dependent hemoglobin/transferrin/lactoferrin family receptor [Vibrio kanaloae]TKF00626.1 TonB-dependent hemoglobin/transferrin/lactoferrin family receptor [Vibrio kanaloae]TKF20159.1 TonB-dependent hemoglobin/transferrin/lactoferrin family receptor [Vibrio kanaloae]